jgi:hypothetical protein
MPRALAGSGDDAESKEQWFDDYFGVPCVRSGRTRSRQTGRSHRLHSTLPEAPKAVFAAAAKRAISPPRRSVAELWISDSLMPLPPEQDVPVVRAMPPYDQQIKEINKHSGRPFSPAEHGGQVRGSRMDPPDPDLRAARPFHSRAVRAHHGGEINFSLAKVMPEPRIYPPSTPASTSFLKWTNGGWTWWMWRATTAHAQRLHRLTDRAHRQRNFLAKATVYNAFSST